MVDQTADEVADPVLDVQGLFALPLSELRTTHEATLPAHFG